MGDASLEQPLLDCHFTFAIHRSYALMYAQMYGSIHTDDMLSRIFISDVLDFFLSFFFFCSQTQIDPLYTRF